MGHSTYGEDSCNMTIVSELADYEKPPREKRKIRKRVKAGKRKRQMEKKCPLRKVFKDGENWIRENNGLVIIGFTVCMLLLLGIGMFLVPYFVSFCHSIHGIRSGMQTLESLHELGANLSMVYDDQTLNESSLEAEPVGKNHGSDNIMDAEPETKDDMEHTILVDEKISVSRSDVTPPYLDRSSDSTIEEQDWQEVTDHVGGDFKQVLTGYTDDVGTKTRQHIRSVVKDVEDSNLSKAVQVESDSNECDNLNLVVYDKKKHKEVLAKLLESIEGQDFNNLHQSWELLKVVLGTNGLVTKVPIFESFKGTRIMMFKPLVPYMNKHQIRKLCLGYLDMTSLPFNISCCCVLDEVLACVNAQRKVEEICPAIKEKKPNDVCYVEDEPFLKYSFAFEAMDKFSKPAVFKDSMDLILEEARAHTVLFDGDQNDELLLMIQKLSNGACQIYSPECYFNVSVQQEKNARAPVSVPSGGDQQKTSTSGQPKQSGSSKGCGCAQDRTEAAESCGGTLMPGGGAGDGSGDKGGGGGDDRKKGGGGKDKLFQIPNRPSKTQRKQLKELYRQGCLILKAFCCCECRCLLKDDTLLNILPYPYGNELICSKHECYGRDCSHDDVILIRLHDTLRPLLQDLFHLFKQQSEDIQAISSAIQRIKMCFECRVCYDNFIFNNQSLIICKNGHTMCSACQTSDTSKICAFCRAFKFKSRTVDWPQCIFQAFKGKPKEKVARPAPRKEEGDFRQTSNPPDSQYIPPGQYEMSESEEEQPEAEMYENYGRSNRENRGTLQQVYHVDEVDIVAEIAPIQGFSYGPPTEPHDRPPPPAEFHFTPSPDQSSARTEEPPDRPPPPAEFQFTPSPDQSSARTEEPLDTQPPPAGFQFTPSPSQSMTQEPLDDGLGDFLFLQRKFDQQLNTNGVDLEEERNIEVGGVFGAVGGYDRSNPMENTFADGNVAVFLKYLKDDALDVCLPPTEVQDMQQLPTEDSAVEEEDRINASQEEEDTNEEGPHAPGMEAAGETDQTHYARNDANKNAREDADLEADSAVDAASQEQVTLR